MKLRSILAGALLVVWTGAASAQSGLENVASHSYTATAQSDIGLQLYKDGSFYLSEAVDRTGPGPWRYRLVQLDALTGRQTVLFDPGAKVDPESPGPDVPAFLTANRLLTGFGSRLAMFDRQTMEHLSSILLRDHVLDVTELKGELNLLQISSYDSTPSVVRFSNWDFSYLGQEKLKDLDNFPLVRFHSGSVLGLGSSRECISLRTCRLARRVALDGVVAGEVRLDYPRETDYKCGAQGVQEADDGIVLFQAACRLFAVDAQFRSVLFSIDLEPQKSFDMAMTPDLIFVRAMDYSYRPGRPGPADPIPVSIYDRRDGKRLAVADLPPGRLETAGDKLVVWRLDTYRDLKVDVFRADISRLRPLGPLQ